MVDKQQLEVALRAVSKKSKWILGYREVVNSVKGSRLVVYSRSLPAEEESKLKGLCEASEVPFLFYEGTSVELGGACGQPHRALAASIKSAGEVDLSGLLRFVERSGE